MGTRGSFTGTVRHKLDGALDDDFVERVNRALKNYVAETLVAETKVTLGTKQKLCERLAKIASGRDVRLGSKLGLLIEEKIRIAALSYPNYSRQKLAAEALRRLEYQNRVAPIKDTPAHEGDIHRIRMIRSINVAWLLTFDFVPKFTRGTTGYASFLERLLTKYSEKLAEEFQIPRKNLERLSLSSAALETVFRKASVSEYSGRKKFLKSLIEDIEDLASSPKSTHSGSSD